MSPEENIDIESFSLSDSKDDFFKIKFLNKEKRINIYHFVTHLLAFIIVLTYIIMILFSIEVPKEYSTIVSVVAGFYFARSLFNN